MGKINLIRRDCPRAHRAEGVPAICPEPLLVAVLQVARGHVIDDGIAPHMLHRAGLGECCARLCR